MQLFCHVLALCVLLCYKESTYVTCNQNERCVQEKLRTRYKYGDTLISMNTEDQIKPIIPLAPITDPSAHIDSEMCASDIMREIRINNPRKITVGHLNINSIPNKFDGIMNMVEGNLDIFLISETKINNSFPDAQFFHEGYSHPHRRDRCLGGGGLLMYVNENITSRLLKSHDTPEEIEILCVEINLRKQKWVVLGIYRPPNINDAFFCKHLSRVIDCYSKKYDNFIIMGDFNLEPTDEQVKILLPCYNLYNLVKENTCFNGPPKCYDLILTNKKHSFQNTLAVTTGFSDFHKLPMSVLKTEFVKTDPIRINYRDYKKFNASIFQQNLEMKLSSDKNSHVDYSSFQNIFCEVLNHHAPLKKKTLRANNSPFMTKPLRKLIMNRSRSKNAYFKNKTANNW